MGPAEGKKGKGFKQRRKMKTNVRKRRVRRGGRTKGFGLGKKKFGPY